MIFADINITGTGVVESTIVYGIVHSIWTGIKWGLKHLETEAGQVIHAHVKNNHRVRFKHCFEDSCAIPGTAPDLIRQAEQH